MGLSGLTRLEIRAWEDDEGRTLSMWERKAILAIDAALVRISAAQAAKRDTKESKP